jgi:hypothetical protein
MGFGSVKDLLDLSPIYGEKNRSKKGAKGRPYFMTSVAGNWGISILNSIGWTVLGCPASSTADDLMFTFFKFDNGASSSIAPTSPLKVATAKTGSVEWIPTPLKPGSEPPKLLFLVAVLDSRWT